LPSNFYSGKLRPAHIGIFNTTYIREHAMTLNRRTFVIQSVAGAGILAAATAAQAQAELQDADAGAVALGYKSDASKTDKVKYPKYAAGQTCANCALFQAGTSGCPLFAGKKVAAKGWCSAWAKKA
jgi:High potential iron-sulfur protein